MSFHLQISIMFSHPVLEHEVNNFSLFSYVCLFVHIGRTARVNWDRNAARAPMYDDEQSDEEKKDNCNCH